MYAISFIVTMSWVREVCDVYAYVKVCRSTRVFSKRALMLFVSIASYQRQNSDYGDSSTVAQKNRIEGAADCFSWQLRTDFFVAWRTVFCGSWRLTAMEVTKRRATITNATQLALVLLVGLRRAVHVFMFFFTWTNPSNRIPLTATTKERVSKGRTEENTLKWSWDVGTCKRFCLCLPVCCQQHSVHVACY